MTIKVCKIDPSVSNQEAKNHQFFHNSWKLMDSNNIEGFKELLKNLNGADINAFWVEEHQWTILSTAVGRGKIEFVEALIEHGADINILDDEGRSPFYSAVRSKNIEMAKLLVKHNCKIDKRDFVFNGLLCELPFKDDEETIKFLEEKIGIDIFDY